MVDDNNSYQPKADEILEQISQCVISTDLDGIVNYWNAACEQIFGYSRDEMINQPLNKIYPSIAEDQYQDDLKTLREGGEVFGQWKSITKDGSFVWIDVHAKPLLDEYNNPKGIIASAHNIQKLKEVEEELEESKAKAQAILETTVDGIITINEQGIILTFNKSASRIFGYSEEEVVGQHINILLPDPDKSHQLFFMEQYQILNKRRVVGPRREFTGKRKDGSVFPMELSVSEAQWNNKKIYTGVVNDISERRRLESEILRISEEERRNLGQDLHDGLGQMLTGIRLISKNLAQQLKANGVPGADEVDEISNLIKEADEYAKALAHGLVHVDFEKEGLHTALKQLCRQVEKLFNIECIFHNRADVSICNNLQAMHLYRITQEAISNAVKHGKAGNIEIDLSAHNSTLELSIKDDGIGFSESQKKEKKQGMGIHIMRYRANILSGRIEIKETKDKKTKVVCHIPQKA